MRKIVCGGLTNYGEVLGVLMLDTLFPRILGDIGNANSFGFPVKYHVIRNATPEHIALKTDPTFLAPFIEGAKALERDGVRAIATSCGFLAIWQNELAAAVSVPVLTSSLLQVPLAWQLTGKRPVGIITARAENLTEAHLAAVGIHNIQIFVADLGEAPEFTRTFIQNAPELDIEAVRREVVDQARKLVEAHPEIGSLVLECTNLPPYSADMRTALARPVFDVITLCNHAVHAVSNDSVGM